MRRAVPKTALDAAVRVQLDLSYAARAPWAPSRRQFLRWIEAVLAQRREAAVISIRVVGRARSRSLNAHYRRKHRATNVLSFAGAGRLPDGRWLLGELVICAPVVAAEARRQKKSIDAHWAHMTVHGVLHLLGFDHEAEPAAVKMESREAQILDRLGFSDPYA
jgi:probable rRNA maturation factor